jgi:hypothetical protein
MDKPELKRETKFRLAEHQILLSFNNDEDAYPFEDWWYEEGFEMYQKYVERMKEEE